MIRLTWLEPRLQPTWTVVRWLWTCAALATWLPRTPSVAEIYSGADVAVPTPYLALAPLSPPLAWALHAAVIAALLVTLMGRRARLGLTLFLLASTCLLLHEALNIKAYDRLLAWQALLLLCAPGGGRGDRVRSPAAQVAMLLLYANLYGANGWFKLLSGPDWWEGRTLALALADRDFGGGALALWVSGRPWVAAPLAWLTIAFEVAFPLLVWVRRLRPWLLLAGVALHLGMAATMQLGPFGLVILAAYPVLLGDRSWQTLVDAAAARWRRILAARIALDPAAAPRPTLEVGTAWRRSSRGIAAAATAGTLLFTLERATATTGTPSLDVSAGVALWSLHVAIALATVLAGLAWLGARFAWARIWPSRSAASDAMVSGLVLVAAGALPVGWASSALGKGAWIARQPWAPALQTAVFAATLGALATCGWLAARLHDVSARSRAVVCGVFLGVASLTALLDSRLFPGLYAPVHALLSAVTAASAVAACWTALGLMSPEAPTARRTTRIGAALGALAVAGAVLLVPGRRGALVLASQQAAQVLPAIPAPSARSFGEMLGPDLPGELVVRRQHVDPVATGRLLGGRRDLSVLLVLVDTLRADAVIPGRGEGKPFSRTGDTPFLDDWLARSYRFRHVVSQASCTRPSLRPTFRSLDVPDDLGRVGIALGTQARAVGLAPFAVVPPYIESDAADLLEGFEQVAVYTKDRQEVAVDRARDLIASTDGRRFLGWVHLYALHDPYFAGRPTDRSDGTAADRYRKALRWVDAELARLMEGLEAAGRADSTVVILAADHGESLGERGRHGHGVSVSEVEIRVPLAIHLPGQGGGEIDTPVGNIDLVPTMLDLLGAPPSPAHRGRSLVPVLLGTDRDVVAHYVQSSQGDMQGIVVGSDKLVRREGAIFHRYDVAKDPGETMDLFDPAGDLDRALGRAMRRKNPALFGGAR